MPGSNKLARNSAWEQPKPKFTFLMADYIPGKFNAIQPVAYHPVVS